MQGNAQGRAVEQSRHSLTGVPSNVMWHNAKHEPSHLGRRMDVLKLARCLLKDFSEDFSKYSNKLVMSLVMQ